MNLSCIIFLTTEVYIVNKQHVKSRALSIYNIIVISCMKKNYQQYLFSNSTKTNKRNSLNLNARI